MRLCRPQGHTCSANTRGGLMGWLVAFSAYISPMGLARAPDLLGVNLDTDREDFDLLDMPHPVGAISPFSVSGPFPFSREERTSSKNTNCKISGPPRQPVAVACKLAYVKLAFIFSPQ